MSGSKYTTVDSSELANLRRDSSQLRALRQDLPERIENAVRETQQNLESRLAPIEARQRDYSRAIKGLSADIREVEQGMAERLGQHIRKTRQEIKETNANLERQRRELRQELQDAAKRLEDADRETEERLKKEIRETEAKLQKMNEKTRQEMKQQEQRLNHAISNERDEREKGLKAANERIDAIHQDRDRITGIARDRLKDAQILHDFIAANYQHEHFTPNQLNQLASAINLAQGSLNQGASEAALAESNNAYQNLSNLRLELEQLDQEWRTLQAQAFGTASRLLSEAQANRKLADVEATGEIVEVNYWTGGKLTCLEEDIIAALNDAENKNKPLSIADMHKMVEITLPEMDHRISDIVAEAQLAVISSQLRTNIADKAMSALETQGFEVIENGGVYEGEDMRGAFVAKAVNKAGSEVVISVIPEGDKNRMTIDSFEPSAIAPGVLLRRSQEMAQAMRNQGLDVTNPATASENPSETNRNLETVRKRKTIKSQSVR